ncbi:MAG: glycosyl hydrolase-related protein [Bacteroidota bacterium]
MLCVCLTAISPDARSNDPLTSQYEFYGAIRGSFEGFHTSQCQNTISYHSLRNDITEGLITRATNGSMAIEWETEAIPGSLDISQGARFVWLAANDRTDKSLVFEVFVNGVKRFTIRSGMKRSWTLTHPEGGEMSFHYFGTDHHDDNHGYMTLYAPGSWLNPGNPVTIRIVGEAAGDNTWMIVYKADDVVEHLERLTQFEAWLKVSIKKDRGKHHLQVSAPAHFADRRISLASGNSQRELRFEKDGDVVSTRFSLEGDLENQSMMIRDAYGELLYLPDLKKDTLFRKLLSQAALINELQVGQGQYHASSRRSYKPRTVSRLLALSRSPLSRGEIYLMNSSHQDIAWMDSPEKCILERDTMLITPLMEQAQADPAYRFDIEDALMIREFISRHPDRKGLMGKLLREGQISCGSSFTQPYEEMYSGESLVRQFYFGRKWLKDEFGYEANTYWNVDVPGRTLQMPQILKKSGSPYMVISRHEKGVFNWYSPDSSFVTVYSPGHYSEAFGPLQKEFFDAAEYLAVSALEWERYFVPETSGQVIPVLSDWDMSPAKDYSGLIRQWESIAELRDEQGEVKKVELPQIRIVTTPEFFQSFTGAANALPSILGERPALWLYIHGPGHQKALKASREGDILLTMAEKFATINAMTRQSMASYPSRRFREAWEAKIYPDHGWGGKNGQITDDLFRRKYEYARNEASQILENSTRSIASQIKTKRKKGIPVVVFNSLNWERSELVKFGLDLDEGAAVSLSVSDAGGEQIPSQYMVEEKYPDGSIRHASVSFLARSIPSVGYRTFYIQKSPEQPGSAPAPTLENRFYRIKMGEGGLTSIFDKELEKELIDTAKFSAGEVFTMQSVGNGAGEFDKIQQPGMEGFGKSGDYTAPWEPGESGDLFTAWYRRSKLPHATVEQKVILHHQLKKIDFEIALLNWEGVIYREFRMALPLDMKHGQVAYEVPFGVVEVGKDEMEGAAGERYQVPARDLHPRGIGNWIGASDESFGVTLSSSVAVADYLDPTHPVPGVLLQPLLLASRQSCHWEGNQYLQTGNHHFSFSLSSHKPGWIHGYRHGKQANEKLYVVVNPVPEAGARLPVSESFFSLDQEDVIISTIKKAEDEQAVIVRMYNLTGKSRKIHLNHRFNFEQATLTNLIEEGDRKIPLMKNQVELSLPHHAIETLKLK